MKRLRFPSWKATGNWIRDTVIAYKRAFVRLWEEDGPGFATQMAYQALFAIFPSLLLLAVVINHFGTEDLLAQILTVAARYLPYPMVEMIRTNLESLIRDRLPGALTIGMLLLLWNVSAFVEVVLKGISAVYRIPDCRHFLVRRLVALGLVVFFGVSSALSFNLFVFGIHILQWIESTLRLGSALSTLLQWIRWPLVFASMTFSAMLLYALSSAARLQLKQVWLGALTFSALWLLTTVAFSFYVTNFADFNRFYGALGSIIMMLTWFYLSSLLFVYGAAVNGVRLNGQADVRNPEPSPSPAD